MGDEAELMRISYDLERAADQMRSTAYPVAEIFATENVLSTPTGREALEFLEPRTLS
jgi:hypothetical protein